MAYTRLALILGNCLFHEHQRLQPDSSTLFYMAEDEGLCSHYRYHQHKLVFFLSAMRSHADHLKQKRPLVYWPLTQENRQLSFEAKLEKTIAEYGVKSIVTYDIEDHFMEQRIRRFCERQTITLEIVDSPGFITTKADFQQYLASVQSPFMHTFYIRQRKSLNLLLDDNGQPLYGKWSFDQANRNKLPKDLRLPESCQFTTTRHTHEVIGLIKQLFPGHPGNADHFAWGTTREHALEALEHFLNLRFAKFGPYQDAIASKQTFLFHSTLSPYLNTGLLEPGEVVDRAIAISNEQDVPYQSLEGFIRQIIGWREFMRGIYHTQDLHGNFFDHERKLSAQWYEGTTGILPLDDSIRKVQEYAYLHHIERLMITGNLMLLCEIDPMEVYRWFMELFIDSADWVMAPNVLGMSQFADGGIVATKPYICGSNYLLKMSDYRKGDWCEPLDGLYWRFIDRKRTFFGQNPRMNMMVKMLDKIAPERRERIFAKAESFIEQVTT